MSSSEFSATSSISFSRYSCAWTARSSGISASRAFPLPSPSYSKAFMSIRSITPRTSCSEPMGISVATTWEPKASLSESRARKKSARSRSSMLTNTSRARPSPSARRHRRSVCTSTPITALITTTAASTTRSAASVSAMKLGSPGVSIRLILRSANSNEATLAPIDISLSFSSGSKSQTVVPSSTRPRRLVTPASNSRASQRLVLPLPRCPIRATLRMRSAGLWATWPIYSLLAARYLRLAARRSTRGGRSEEPAASLGLEARPQGENRLRVQLRDARLRHPEHLADLAQGEVLVVVEGDHQPLPLGQGLDRVGEAVLQLGCLSLGLGIDGGGVVNRVQSRGLTSG